PLSDRPPPRPMGGPISRSGQIAPRQCAIAHPGPLLTDVVVVGAAVLALLADAVAEAAVGPHRAAGVTGRRAATVLAAVLVILVVRADAVAAPVRQIAAAAVADADLALELLEPAAVVG